MTRSHLVLTLTLSCLGACSREPSPEPSGLPQPASSAAAAVELDRMDTRTPVPLLPMMAKHQKENMRDHLAAVHEIVAALATDDFAGVESAAGRIGFSEQMGKMCTHMGAGAPGFTEQALGFHRTADGIALAARARDRARVLSELGATLQSCTACHAAYKQEIVDAPTWQQRTSSARLPSHGASH